MDEIATTYAHTLIEQKRLTMSWRVDRDVVLELERVIERDEIKYRLERLVPSVKLLSQTVPVYHSFEFPKTPWDMIKMRNSDRWWMRWWVKRHPVRYGWHTHTKDVTFTRYAMFPDANVDLKNKLGRSVIVENVSEEWR